MIRVITAWRTAAHTLTAALLVSCGGTRPAQNNDTTPTLSGTATYDSTIVVGVGGVTVIGSAGKARTSVNSASSDQYSVSLQLLAGPYAMHSVVQDVNGASLDVYGVATAGGVANVTPLTTLLVAQLLGQDPTNAFGVFGSPSDPEVGMTTEANIQAAQAKVIAYLQSVDGITVEAPGASFVTTPFKAVLGDPMFDTITALLAKLKADNSTLQSLAAQIGSLARLCIAEKIEITVGGATVDFCPSAKTATPEESNTSILDYVFTTPANDTLTLQIQADTLLSVKYLVAASGTAYTCAQINCTAITLGVPAADLTRTITFANAPLAADNGAASLNGTLLGPVPGISLPVLPCNNNKYFVIFQDRSVIGNCINTNDLFGLGGTLSANFGAPPSRAGYAFAASTPNPQHASLLLDTDGNDSLLFVSFALTDPATGAALVRFVCQSSTCNGVTLGPVTTDTDTLGPNQPVLIRTITFDNTTLTGLNSDGSSNQTSVTLDASATTLFVASAPSDHVFPPLAPCPSGDITLSVTVETGPFNFCADPQFTFSTILDNGELDLSVTDTTSFSTFSIYLLPDGTLDRTAYNSNEVSDVYECVTTCPGLTVSTPDAEGRRSATLSSITLHEMLIAPLPGPRTALFNTSGPIAFPVPVAISVSDGGILRSLPHAADGHLAVPVPRELSR